MISAWCYRSYLFGISLPLVLSQQMHVADHPAFSLPNDLANYSCTYCFHRKQNVRSCTTKVNSKYIDTLIHKSVGNPGLLPDDYVQRA